jgi:hypothetical protein
MFDAGPGSYNNEAVKFLKKEPSATFGNYIRQLGESKMMSNGPCPSKYNSHRPMTDQRSLSN